MTGDSSLSIGDVLRKRRDISPLIDSSVFSSESTELVEGSKTSQNITSNSEVNLSTKFKGQAVLSEHFKLEEAGLVVDFESKNEMFLKVQGLRQQSIRNFVDFRKELLAKYTRGEISSRVYIVRGLVYADKFYLQFSGSNGGTIGFNLDADMDPINAEVSADFSVKWKKQVGYHVDGSNGGVLAYRVSGVRLRRHLIPESVHKNILTGISEADALEGLPLKEREELVDADALEIVDLTDDFLLDDEELA